MKDDDDQFFVNQPEPFFALLVGAGTGYVSALLMLLVIFPVLNLTALWGHLWLAVLLVVFGLGGALFDRIARRGVK